MSCIREPLPFYIVDAFAVKPLTGNPLAVVDGGEDLSLDVLQRIAREFNQSETTFLLSPTRPDADWRLRSFTAAGVEVFGVGHNALGAWWWLAEAGRLTLSDTESVFHQELGQRTLPLTITLTEGRLERVSMQQEAPVFGKQPTDLMQLAMYLDIDVLDLAVDRMACQVVSTGTAHLMVPIVNREIVDRIHPDARGLLSVLRAVGAEGCYVFSLDTRQTGANAYARFFGPTVGIWEDPATGSAAGPLAAHLVAHNLAARGRPLVIEQGTAMGRTSLIQVEVLADAVKLSGRGVVVAGGKLFL